MNIAAIQRIAWKELRQLGALFIALMILANLCRYMIQGSTDPVPAAREWTLLTLGLFSTMFAAAAGGILYASEDDEGTRQRLHMFPLHSLDLSIGKIGIALVLSLAFFAGCVLVAWLAGSSPREMLINPLDAQHRVSTFVTFVGNFGLATMEFFAWSLLFSMVVRRPLIAALAGIFSATLVIQLIARLYIGAFIDPYSLATYIPTFPVRAVLLLVVLAVDGWLAHRWVHIPADEIVGKWRFPLKARSRSADVTSPKAFRPLATPARYGWEAVRTGWVWMIVLAPLIPLAVLIGGELGTVSLLCVVGGIVGVVAFSATRNPSHRSFMTHHGARPLAYWATHLTVWLVWIVTTTGVIVTGILAISFLQSDIPIQWTAFNNPETTWRQSGWEILDITNGIGLRSMAIFWWTFAAAVGLIGGHFSASLFEKPLFAGIATLPFCGLLGIWLSLCFAAELPLWQSVLPLLVVFLTAGYFANRLWLNERLTKTRALALASIVVMAWSGLTAALMHRRATEIPVVPVDVSAYRRSESDSPDLSVIDTMHSQLDAAMFDEALPANIYPEIGGVVSRVAEGVQRGIPAKALIGQKDEDATTADEWFSFVQLYPGESIESQIDRLRDHLRSQEDQFDRLHDALRFSIDNIDAVLDSPPWIADGDSTAQRPPLSTNHWQTNSMLNARLDLAIIDGDPHEMFVALRDLISFESLKAQVYAESDGKAQTLLRFLYWTSLENLDEADLREALQLTQETWFLYPSRERCLEHDYLALHETIENGRSRWFPRDEDFRFLILEQLIQLPSENERSRRLVDLWWARNNELLHHMRLPIAEQAKLNRVKLAGVSQSQFADFVDNSIHFRFNPSYKYGLARFSRFHNRNPSSEARLQFEATLCELLVLKLTLMNQRIESGELPETVYDAFDAFRIAYPPFSRWRNKPETLSSQKTTNLVPMGDGGGVWIENPEVSNRLLWGSEWPSVLCYIAPASNDETTAGSEAGE